MSFELPDKTLTERTVEEALKEDTNREERRKKKVLTHDRARGNRNDYTQPALTQCVRGHIGSGVDL